MLHAASLPHWRKAWTCGRYHVSHAVAGAALLTAVAWAPVCDLRVTGEDGRIRWSLPVRPGSTVTLAYTNSIYLAATEEVLVVRPDGFAVTEVRSTIEAVLAYNGLAGPYRREGAFLAAPASGTVKALVVRIGQTGRQRLMVAGHEIPLYTAGAGARLTVAVVRRP